MAAAKRPLRIVIIGAGIGDLAAAVALRQRGYEVALYERVTKREEVGASLQIGPNGVKVLCALGLEDEEWPKCPNWTKNFTKCVVQRSQYVGV